MSNKLINAAWGVSDVSSVEKIVLVNLGDRADSSGECFPSHERICEDCSITERTLRNVIGSLKAKGHITVTREKHRSYRGGSVFNYIIHPVTPAPRSAVTPETGATDTGKLGIRHRKITSPTPESGATPLYNHPNPINPKGEETKTPPRRLSDKAGELLAKDLERLNRLISDEQLRINPNSELIRELKGQRKDITEELEERGRNRAVNIKPSMQAPEQPKESKSTMSHEEEKAFWIKCRTEAGL